MNISHITMDNPYHGVTRRRSAKFIDLAIVRFSCVMMFICLLLIPPFAMAASSLDDLMPEFAGRGNIMGAAEVCNFQERHAFREQTMHLIKESGLSLDNQKQLVNAFDIEHRHGVDFYNKTDKQETCAAIKAGLSLMTEAEITLWKQTLSSD